MQEPKYFVPRVPRVLVSDLFRGSPTGPPTACSPQRPDQLAQLLEALQLAAQRVNLPPAARLPQARRQIEALRPLHHACSTAQKKRLRPGIPRCCMAVVSATSAAVQAYPFLHCTHPVQHGCRIV